MTVSLSPGTDGMAQRPMTPAAAGDIQAQWARVRGRLRDEFGEAAFRSWLKSMTLAEANEGRVRISVPTRFLRDWVAAHYADRIKSLWNAENDGITTVDIFVAGAAAPADGAARAPTAILREKEAREVSAREGLAREGAGV